MDSATTLAELKERIRRFGQERDWLRYHSPKNLAMALAAEAGELMEPFLWTDADASAALLADPEQRRAIEHELADVLIYALQFANRAEIDLATAITAKMEINAARYPVAKARGRADKYDRLD
ncbi:MAG: nucleotide pyrophosphohydrolase [Puniceicoccaceae bacterium]|nr:MAG: nucleotide pyrophosphohydrolase [Puniceicoccaceae bacterium]